MRAGSVVVVGAMLAPLAMLPLPAARPQGKTMDNRTFLKDLVLTGRNEEAAKVARSLGPQAGDALLEASSSTKSSARMLALELAADNPSPGSCRTVLGRLSDSNATVRSVAGSLVRICRDHDNALDLVKALDQQQDASIRNSLVAQLGIAGSQENVPLLRRLSNDPQLANSASLALIQLGDSEERRQLIRRLSDDDLQTRTGALRDVSTVGDPKLAAWLGPALADVRDAVPISKPHASPAVYARVCDFTVILMAQLGYHFSFPVSFLERRPLEQIQEAARMVEAMPRENR